MDKPGGWLILDSRKHCRFLWLIAGVGCHLMPIWDVSCQYLLLWGLWEGWGKATNLPLAL